MLPSATLLYTWFWGRHSNNTDMDVSENRGTPKSSILIGFSIINHPFWGTSIFGNTDIGEEETYLNRPKWNHHGTSTSKKRLELPCRNAICRKSRDHKFNIEIVFKKKWKIIENPPMKLEYVYIYIYFIWPLIPTAQHTHSASIFLAAY